MRSILVAVVLSFFVAHSAAAERVVVTGDSLTQGYFAKIDAPGAWLSVAKGGTDAKRYVGWDPHSDGTFRNFVDEVLFHNPDTIVFLLGTNDATRPDPWFTEVYVPVVRAVFDAWEASGAKVIILTPIPNIRPGQEVFDQRITDSYVPWIIQEGTGRGFTVVDLWSEIQLYPNWEQLYDDGVHWNANNGFGYEWMANRVETTVALLEPAPSHSNNYTCGMGVELVVVLPFLILGRRRLLNANTRGTPPR